MADVAVVEHPHHHEDEQHVENGKHPQHMDTSTKTMGRLWIRCRSELVSNAQWRSWVNSVLVNRANVRELERCGQQR